MFPALWIMTFKPARVKTEGSFTAEDPWNQNRRSSFTIEAYIMAAKGPRPTARTKVFGSYLLGIRSEADGVERMLPESLVHLWRTNRVPSEALPRLLEALPRLLKEMGPMLGKSDFRSQVLGKGSTTRLYLATGLCALAFLWSAGMVVFAVNSEFVVDGIIFVAVLGLLFAGLLYARFFRPRARRRRQMDRALAHL